MNCKKVQEIILTDYLDGELAVADKEKLNVHLSCCKTCEMFFVDAKESVMDPFEKIDRAEPSTKVWSNIKRDILEENNFKTSKHFDFLGLFKTKFIFGGVALALFAFAAMILMPFFQGIDRQSNTGVQSEVIKEMDAIYYVVDELVLLTDVMESYGSIDNEAYLVY